MWGADFSSVDGASEGGLTCDLDHAYATPTTTARVQPVARLLGAWRFEHSHILPA